MMFFLPHSGFSTCHNHTHALVAQFPGACYPVLVPCSQVGVFGLILAKFELSSPPLTQELMSAAQKQASRMTVHGIKTLVRALALLHLYDWTLLLELGTVARSQLGRWRARP